MVREHRDHQSHFSSDRRSPGSNRILDLGKRNCILFYNVRSMKHPIERGKLTKKFLMELPVGVYLASGVGVMPGQPSFAESIVPVSDREDQWRRIVDARVNGRACTVFQNARPISWNLVLLSSFTASSTEPRRMKPCTKTMLFEGNAVLKLQSRLGDGRKVNPVYFSDQTPGQRTRKTAENCGKH